MNTPRTKFYRDKINGKIMGVCAGIADYTGVDVLWVRLGAVALTLMGIGIIPLLYLGLGMFTSRKPAHLYYNDRQEQRFWQGVRQSPARTAREVRAQFRELDRRLADIELHYVSSNARLSDEIERLR
ncbi:envelope stress response membrane protein PspC [Novosphingobium sp.]|jgi:phage shock protein C|uniref:envelope stress response membrane protein PspC n=1 Tax=Novosphingobium sp. TaxID=1874826 RepID=UPI0022C1ADCC|nr:envelope stress response membrane protein PspC [Novosphingobium sp.]MCZ8019887.1 envelope stress response membrane protein PspC [Novosphingobium sp.]MCZ8035787.1 envelope stress response membrane protein PspC [Novosphingobium sp.]MCZ8052664.1 envelope stress response membrane protein PspC [Novosphingobium sp.]MCZ8060768.1 envelope stress response membrane protein PspC [Novosphingobium sp.]MCZ8233340.1 envelope stress response membrane protein PspC [Novosphingobium sp.]